MMDFIRDICEACGGQCCDKFAVFYYDWSGTLCLNPPHFDLNDSPELSCNYLENPHWEDCYFNLVGGCPGMVRPAECKVWFCRWTEAVYFGYPIPDSWTNRSRKLRAIAKVLGKC